MAILLDAQQLTASFGARPLFEGVSFTVDDRERIGLIGPNGAGKSTLLRILAEAASADGGATTAARLCVALLEQTPRPAAGATVRDAIAEGSALRDGDDGRDGTPGLRHAGPRGGAGGSASVRHAGGVAWRWKKRVAIGRALARRPDLLLLDSRRTTRCRRHEG
jgi:ATP-binding cassette subfamily F protein uup